MIVTVPFGLLICAAALFLMLWMLRRDRLSLGLPLAYLTGLLLIHVPGAWAFMASRGVYGGRPVELGFAITTIGLICFVTGVALVRPAERIFSRRRQRMGKAAAPRPGTITAPVAPKEFWLFCLYGGWFLNFSVSLLVKIPSIGAAVQMGGSLWMLGVALGLANALHRRKMGEAILWAGAVAVYPVMMLVIGGFASYGAAAAIIVLAFLAISERRYWRSALAITIVGLVGMSVFVNYFAARNDLRAVAWGGGSIEQRLDVVENAAVHFKWFDASNPDHLTALDKRLNQNYFVGVAVDRLERGQVDFLHGRSLIDGLLALIPRALWPEKPVYGGSGDLVRDITGLQLDDNTSWGVGNVLEFYMNFGMPGLVIGFLLLGFVLALLDRQAATSLREARLGRSFLFFLPAVALIQPNGSLVELFGGSAAALAAGFFWQWVWSAWVARKGRVPMRMAGQPRF